MWSLRGIPFQLLEHNVEDLLCSGSKSKDLWEGH